MTLNKLKNSKSKAIYATARRVTSKSKNNIGKNVVCVFCQDTIHSSNLRAHILMKHPDALSLLDQLLKEINNIESAIQDIEASTSAQLSINQDYYCNYLHA